MAIHYAPNYFHNPQHPITINLIGIGGTGSVCLTLLGRMHVALNGLGHPGFFVTAYDPDTVSQANIGRQLFSAQDIGQNKATLLVSRVNRFFGLDWESAPFSYDKTLSSESDRLKANITISCVDTARSRLDIAEFLKIMTGKSYHPYEKMYYWYDLGNMRTSGQAILGTLGEIGQPESGLKTVSKLPTIIEMYPDLESMDTEEDQGPSCSIAEALNRQDLFINSSLANFSMDIIWKLFRYAKIEHRGVFMNLETMRTNPIPV